MRAVVGLRGLLELDGPAGRGGPQVVGPELRGHLGREHALIGHVDHLVAPGLEQPLPLPVHQQVAAILDALHVDDGRGVVDELLELVVRAGGVAVGRQPALLGPADPPGRPGGDGGYRGQVAARQPGHRRAGGRAAQRGDQAGERDRRRCEPGNAVGPEHPVPPAVGPPPRAAGPRAPHLAP